MTTSYHQDNCANKIPYISRQEAKHNARRVQSRTGVKTEVYQCQVCWDFHTTSLSKFSSRRTKQAVRAELSDTIKP
jgi:hypothetical protein